VTGIEGNVEDIQARAHGRHDKGRPASRNSECRSLY
jgi:ribosomal protein S28E/S33